MGDDVRARRLMRRIAKWGLIVSLAILALGLAIAVRSAVVDGGWWLAQRPWMEVGMRLTTLGLVASGLFAGLRLSVEPVGLWRLAALPSAVLVVSFWLFAFTVGLPTSGPVTGDDTDAVVILYTVPEMMVILVIATLQIAAIPLVARWWRGRALVDDADEEPVPDDT